ncbi:hypothetical protein BH09BAC5_BH09BAC5_11080 [soil metagenome]
MPIKSIAGYKILEPDDSYSKKYWPQITKIVKDNYGEKEIIEYQSVQTVLRHCFAFFCQSFINLLNQKPKASFFVFVHDIHEDSIDLWRLKDQDLPINGEDLAGARRIMKCIIEQGCNLDLEGHPILYKEICEQFESYSKHLDELAYIGRKAIEYSEYIARSQICPHSIGVKIEDGELTIFIYPPFNGLFKFFFEDHSKHSGSIVASNCIPEIKNILAEQFNVSYDHLCDFIFIQRNNPHFRFALSRKGDLITQMHKAYSYSSEFLNTFYSGLTISKANVMSFEDCLLKTQDKRRYMYRPIVEYIIDGEPYWIVGANKWSESLSQLSANCFPFGQFPDEWSAITPLQKFIRKVANTHDSVLENPAIEVLQNKNLKFDRNIKNLKRSNNQNISLIKKNVGEIDLVFLDEQGETIYLAECKHNRSRYEYNNWKRDIANFRSTYEKQLENKFIWASNNKTQLLEHFEILYSYKISDKNKYRVIPLFIINAPTLYMYDSDYIVFTLHDLEMFLNNQHITREFEGEIRGKKVKIKKPYFRNAEKYFD